MKALASTQIITTTLKLVGAFILGASVLAGCSKPKPADDEQLTLKEYDSLMGTRYTEFLIVWGNPLKKEFVAGVYNTVGLNSPEGKVDSSPQDQLDKVNMEQGVLATSSTSRIFLGQQVQCTQCHNHPFNDWTQQQFWSMNSFFRGTRRVNGANRGQFSLVDNPNDEIVFYEKRSGVLDSCCSKTTERLFITVES